METNSKTVLITGGSRGIGKAIALRLAKEGNRILVGYSKSKDEAEEVVSRCGKGSELIHVDVTDTESIHEATKKKIDVLINNAGVLAFGKHEGLDDEEIVHQTAVNVDGVFLMSKAFLGQLQKNKGIIVNISSVAPRYSSPGYIAYSATKAAVVNFTKGLANEYSKVKAYSVSPGLTATDMTENQGVPAEKVAEVVSKVLSGEIGMRSGEDIDVRDYY